MPQITLQTHLAPPCWKMWDHESQSFWNPTPPSRNLAWPILFSKPAPACSSLLPVTCWLNHQSSIYLHAHQYDERVGRSDRHIKLVFLHMWPVRTPRPSCFSSWEGNAKNMMAMMQVPTTLLVIALRIEQQPNGHVKTHPEKATHHTTEKKRSALIYRNFFLLIF